MELQFHPFEWFEEDYPVTYYERSFQVGIFAKNRDSETCYLRVTGYHPTAVLELPQFTDDKSSRFPWTNGLEDGKLFLSELMNRIGERRGNKRRIDVRAVDFDTRRRYTRNVEDMIEGEKPQLFLEFDATRDLRDFAEELFDLSTYRGKEKHVNIRFNRNGHDITLKLWEDDISTHKKLTVERNLQYANWLSGSFTSVIGSDKQSTCKHEYRCTDWRTLSPVKAEDCKTWRIHPVIWCFDNEAFSDNPRIFPNAYNIKHELFMISGTLETFEKPETRRKICMMTTDCKKEPKDEYEKILVRDELSLRDAFCQLLHDEEIDMIGGHNIYKFDLPYMDVRFGHKWLQCASRLKHKVPTISDGSWESNNSGTMKITKIGFHGRIAFDTYPITKASIFRLNDYTLNTVCEFYLKERKNDVHHTELFAAFEKFTLARNNLEKCIAELDENGQPKRYHPNVSKKVIDRVQKDYCDALDDMQRITLYCIQDSALVMKLFYKLNLWYNIVAAANGNKVRMADVYDRGLQMKGVSKIYSLCKTVHTLPIEERGNDPYNKPTIFDRRYADDNEDKYKGAICVDPIVDYHHGVITLDVNSMYPNLMKTRNIDLRTYVEPRFVPHFTKEQLIECEWENEDGDPANGVPPTITRHYYLSPKIAIGLFPLMVTNHLTARAAIRKKAIEHPKNEEDVRTNTRIEVEQNQEKLSANGSYGVMGIGGKKNPRMPFKVGAECVTREGRKLLTGVRSFLEEKYGAVIVYGDTDSLMFKLPGNLPPSEIIRMAKEISKAVGLRINPMVMAFEKAGDILCIAHKKYVYYMYDIAEMKDGVPNPNYAKLTTFKNTGVEDTRRDNSKSLKTISKKIRDIIFEGKSKYLPDEQTFQKCVDAIFETAHDIINNKLTLDDFVIYKGLKSKNLYKKGDSAPMRVFAENMKKFGKTLKDGERVGYVVVNPPGENSKTKGSEKMYLVEVYKEQIKYGARIDVTYYLEALENAIDGKLVAAFGRSGFTKERYNKPEIIREIAERVKRTSLKDSIGDYHTIERGLLEEVRNTFKEKQFKQTVPDSFDALALFKEGLETKSPEKRALGSLLGVLRRTGLPLLLPSNTIMNNIITAHHCGLLHPYTKIMASPELYRKLYPQHN